MDFKSTKRNETSPVIEKETAKEKTAPVDKAVDPVEDILEEAVKKVEEVKEVEEVKKSNEYTVIVDLLNVREVPDGKIIKTIKSGETFKGEDAKDGWIKLEDEAGYVMSQFVAPKKG